ncbi:MAG: hypothetical protein GOMPHAMPRED_006211 [Gomphillus americanus]|uniref:Cytochrome P450 n=1 Tax=Gomphillus americanus TaxID=1940652 RepID=A0A8H3EMF4_9LECA|nr:MAG: hypothetical protein GOMPHAMPRED_006211 [Gomphillus americanus]
MAPTVSVQRREVQYYDAFVSIQRGLFNTRDRAQHSRKRKIISHTFSAHSIGQFEQYIHTNLHDLVKQWTKLSNKAQTSTNNPTAYAEIDSLSWFNYLSFDIIGDLAFGRPFGMLKAGADRAAVYSLSNPTAPPTYAPAVQVLNRRGEVSNTLGCLPQLKPWAVYLPDPFFSRGLAAVQSLAGIATAAVQTRLTQGNPDGRKDLLARLIEGKDSSGQSMSESELTAEALTQLIAGSDTTSNTCCAFFYWVTRTPGVYSQLRTELDKTPTTTNNNPLIITYASIKSLPYLDACINETLRIHSTSSLGLPRTVTHPITILNHHFPANTVLSVPTYTLHHSSRIWGADVKEFKPDRWLKAEGGLTASQKTAFIPFSTGPRACVGRNLAEMELKLIVATIVQNFDLEVRQDTLETREGFLRKPLRCVMGMRKRKRKRKEQIDLVC